VRKPFAPQDLDCPDPDGCPVAAQLPPLRTVSLSRGTDWYRVYDATWGYDEHNPGHGDTRFSPIDDPKTGNRLPSMYLAQTPTAALLETVFHSVHQSSPRLIYERDLRGKHLACVRVPARAVLADLRDPELDRLGRARAATVATAAEHYPCTRRLAISALRRKNVQGLIWHSRQAELAGHDPVEVTGPLRRAAVLLGARQLDAVRLRNLVALRRAGASARRGGRREPRGRHRTRRLSAAGISVETFSTR